jgi:serine/threonine protein phosphatase 1
MKRYVLGDIHGRYDALIEVLTKSNFNYDEDILVVLGDVCDGGNQTKEVIDELMKVKKLFYVSGNHDSIWFSNYLTKGFKDEIWLSQGGRETLNSYKLKNCKLEIPLRHKLFITTKSTDYFILSDMIFVHGGFNPMVHIEKQTREFLVWDRNLYKTAQRKPIVMNLTEQDIKEKRLWKKVFIGHTTTQFIGNNIMEPVKFNNLIMMDTGAGWSGKLTIMDIDTEKYWQSKIQTPAVRDDFNIDYLT